MMAETESPIENLLDRMHYYAFSTPEKAVMSFIVGSKKNLGGTIERKYTYQELEKKTTDLALFLRNQGLKEGDRAVLVYPPSLEFVIAFIACLKSGIVAVPVFPPHPGRSETLLMFSKIVDSSGANFALTSTTYNHLKKLSGIKESFSRLKGRNKSFKNGKWPEQLKWFVTDGSNSKSNGKIKSLEDWRPKPNDLAFLQYTSGSTSDPKGVMISHGNLSHNLTIITNELNASDKTVVVSWLPQYHDMGLIGSYLGVIYCGGSGYYMSPMTFLQRPMIWIEAISKYHGTHIQAPNFAYKLTARKFSAEDYNVSSDRILNLSSLQHMINAAEPVDRNSIDIFMNSFKPYGLDENVMFPTYGLAEHTVFVCSGGKQIIKVMKENLEIDGDVIIVKEDDCENEDSASFTTIVGCGYPSKQKVDVRIVDTVSMSEVQNDKVGEIWVNSSSKAGGYFNKPEETQECFRASLSSLSGSESTYTYLRTGDLGFIHNDELFICGRLKDLIIVGGRNHYPQDIESTAEEVSDAFRPGCSAAFTVNQIGNGDEKVALIMEMREVPQKDEVKMICEELITKLHSTIKKKHSIGMSYIVLLKPRTVPKTTSGKIARAWCRKAFLSKSLQVIFSKSLDVDENLKPPMNDEPGTFLKPMEIEASASQTRSPIVNNSKSDVRSMEDNEILGKLTTEIGQLGSIPPESIYHNSPLTEMLDSISISQFKGILEHQYHTKLSDEYLFQNNTTVSKLVEAVKLGYAPDDENNGDNIDGDQINISYQPRSRGLAGALGCPPGVRCAIM